MGLVTKKETVSGGIPIWINVLENALGGFTLDTTSLTAGEKILAGTPISFNEATRLAKPVKMAKLYASATNVATVYQVEKGHNLVTGEFLARSVGSASYAITGIDKSNAAYDAITLGTTLGVNLSAGDALFQSAASGASAGAFIATPKGLLYEETNIGVNESLSVVIRGTIYQRRAPVNSPNLQSLLPTILFSNSY